ncbi:hypothetical protein [Lonsdalea quercina]|uniref:hypothetical protein n=1 Tax=Lonsdalea quercina TaxID=71657 RepID=UPI003975EC24
MFINPHLLSEPRLYTFLRNHLPQLFRGCKLDIRSIQQITYASWHQRYPDHTDQTFHGHWQHLQQRIKEENSLCHALLGQAARYHFDVDDKRRLAVRMDRFDEWQRWLANQSGLPVIAFQLQSILNRFSTPFERRTWLKDTLGYRCLISPYHHLVEDYIEREGLNESHMHLTNTTTMEAMWHYSLCNPQLILKELEEQFNKSERVKLLYATMPDLNHPRQFESLLLLARRLRQLLIAWVQNHPDLSAYKHVVHKLLQNHPHTTVAERINATHAAYGFSLEKTYFGPQDFWTHITEVDLHISILQLIKENSSELMDACYLLYLQCMNGFQRILVQRDDQFGFDQFQKFADDGTRESFEKEYAARFHQLHGPNYNGRSDLFTLEGRFAPKDTQEKNIKLINSILRGFISYAEGEKNIITQCDLNALAERILTHHRPSLRLVAHFIKRPWEIKKPLTSTQKYSIKYREPHFFTLREMLLHNGHILFELLENYPKLRKIITGVDAAANELETPPEVFSVLFRNCRRHGIQHFTYHVGEDFEHLLNGIRAIYEAIEFLDLRNGDRIGHATAIGINPQLWLKKMPDSIFITQGQWLENLLFLRHIALENPSSKFSLAHIEAKIHELAWEIFEEQLNINILQQFFAHRDLEPKIVQYVVKERLCHFVDWRAQEHELIKNIKPEVLALLDKRWFSQKTIDKYEKKEEVSLAFTSFEMLLSAQQFVQSLVTKRHIILETLPTSNVRISHYHSIRDHHLFRWMPVPSRKFDGDSCMAIALGSDDPGIFVTDMRNEFYHLFSTLVTEFNYSETQALTEVAKINENGRIYRFDGPK